MRSAAMLVLLTSRQDIVSICGFMQEEEMAFYKINGQTKQISLQRIHFAPQCDKASIDGPLAELGFADFEPFLLLYSGGRG